MAQQFSVFEQTNLQSKPIDSGVQKVVDMLNLLKENADNRYFRSTVYEDQFEERLVSGSTNPTCNALRELVKILSRLLQTYTVSCDGSFDTSHLEEFGALGCPVTVVHKDAIGPLRIMVQIGVGMQSLLYAVFEVQRKKVYRSNKPPSFH